MIVTIYNKQKDLPLSVASIKLMIPFLLKNLHVCTDEVIVHFVSQTAIGKIHADFFNDPSTTDCISFPIDSSDTPAGEGKHRILGEIFVCPKTAIDYAKSQNLDPYQETKLYIIHGILHLLGHDDLDSPSRRKMRQMEQKCLKICEPFPIFKKRLS